MTSDINRSITVNYTLQNNMPEDIIFSEGRIRNCYDADGIKRVKEYYDNSNQLMSRETYLDNFILSDDTTVRIITPEGYIRADLSQPTNIQHYYHIKDHLGNVRVVAQPSSFNNSLYIHQVNDYYPFGMTYQDDLVTNDLSENVYLYNGKEIQTEMREGWYDYGARFYDAQLGRWHVIDPLVDDYLNVSPYIYALNSPMLLLDRNGEDVIDGKGNKVDVSISKSSNENHEVRFKFATSTTQEVKDNFMANAGRLFQTMVQIETGREYITKANESAEGIHYSIIQGESTDARTTKNAGIVGGVTTDRLNPSTNKVYSAISVYEGSAKYYVENSFNQNQLDVEQKMATNAIHETYHATNEDDIRIRREDKRHLTSKEHEGAYNASNKAAFEFGEKNKVYEKN